MHAMSLLLLSSSWLWLLLFAGVVVVAVEVFANPCYGQEHPNRPNGVQDETPAPKL